MAIANAEAEGGGGGGGGEGRETRNGGGGSRLQVFISSLFSSIGGVFANFQEQDSSEDMDSRAVVVVPRQQVLRGTTISSKSPSVLFSFSFSFGWFSFWVCFHEFL